jgi:ribonucleoside-diphosphate reductase beta chain
MEPILIANPNRYVLFPIEHLDMYKCYKDLVSIRWICEEVDTSKDLKDYDKLPEGEKHFIKRVLGFFAGSDGIVCENLVTNFYDEVQVPEAKAFYAEQISQEAVHSEMYCRLIETYVEDKKERLEIFRSINTQPFIAKKAAWAEKYMDRNKASFATRLMAFAVVEGVFFSGAFCCIFYFKSRGILPGLTLSNEFISRDEGLHCAFAALLYSKLQMKLTQKEAHTLIQEAVDIESEFITDALPCSIIGMNSKMMKQYIKFVADRLLIQLGYEKTYRKKNPFEFMERMSLEGKDNFFEKKVSNYALANSGKSEAQMSFKMDEAF